jgi:hypothetical protein
VAAGSVVVVIFRVALTVRLSAWVSVAPTLSVTWAVKLKLPAVVGVPFKTPPPLRLSPGGRVPAARLHV